ncbi:MAG: hypothetical protein NC409_02245 [Clostridium sp.]|nr:hypothetical protein [Clostridium sp.]
MELSIDEKMRLVREMREKLAREEAENSQSSFQWAYQSSVSEDDRGTHGTFGLRMLLALFLFGGFLYMQKQDMTIADKNAQDIVTLISEDSLPSK